MSRGIYQLVVLNIFVIIEEAIKIICAETIQVIAGFS